MVLGSLLGGHELWISTSENMGPKPLSASIHQSIYGPGEWPDLNAQLHPKERSAEGCAKGHISCEVSLHLCFWNLHKYSLAHVTVLRCSSDVKPLVGPSGLPPHSGS